MKRIVEWVILSLVFAFCIYASVKTYSAVIPDKVTIGNHLGLLAESFSKGQVFLNPINRPTTDIVDIGGRQYLYFGPFPSLILAPIFLLFGYSDQSLLGFLSLIVTFLSVIFIAKKLNFELPNAIWLGIAFCFSTVFFGISILPLSSWVVQAVGVTATFLALAEFFYKRRPFVISLFIAAAGLTRIGLYVGVVFFLLTYLNDRNRLRNIGLLLLPIFLSLLLLSAYSHKRFRSWFETGYKYQSTALSYPMSKNIIPGLVSLTHVPTNLYVLLFKAPDPVVEPYGGFVLKFPYLKADAWGMGIFFTSPIFLFLITLKKNKYLYPLLITTILLAIPSLVYFGIGYSQFGYRYSLDFLPFLFLLLLTSLKGELLLRHKVFITLGVIINCLYLGSVFGVYPLFNL